MYPITLICIEDCQTQVNIHNNQPPKNTWWNVISKIETSAIFRYRIQIYEFSMHEMKHAPKQHQGCPLKHQIPLVKIYCILSTRAWPSTV